MGRSGTGQGDQFGFLFTVKNPLNGGQRPPLAVEHRFEALFHQLSSDPVNHGYTGFKSLDDAAVAPSRTGFRDIRLQQYPGLQQPLGRAFSLAD
jgi:hypothetical protein